MRDDDIPGQLGDLIRYGKIASVDLAAARVGVSFGDADTGPIRFLTGGAGGTRVWSRPKVGEQVIVLCPGGDVAGAIALRGAVCTGFPAIADEDREVVEFEDGAVLAYDPAAHKLEVVLPSGAAASIIAPGGITIDADVRITGDVQIDKGLKADEDVKAGSVSLKDHRHDKVQAGGAVSGKPLP